MATLSQRPTTGEITVMRTTGGAQGPRAVTWAASRIRSAMARDGAVYVCQSCGAVHSKWAGQCTACAAWNTLVEESAARPPGAMALARGAKSRGLAFEGLEAHS